MTGLDMSFLVIVGVIGIPITVKVHICGDIQWGNTENNVYQCGLDGVASFANQTCVAGQSSRLAVFDCLGKRDICGNIPCSFFVA